MQALDTRRGQTDLRTLCASLQAELLLFLGPGDIPADSALLVYRAYAAALEDVLVFTADESGPGERAWRYLGWPDALPDEVPEFHGCCRRRWLVERPDLWASDADRGAWPDPAALRRWLCGAGDGAAVHVPLSLLRRAGAWARDPIVQPPACSATVTVVMLLRSWDRAQRRRIRWWLRAAGAGTGRLLLSLATPDQAGVADEIRSVAGTRADLVTCLSADPAHPDALLYNQAVEAADGELVCLVHDDVHGLDTDALATLVSLAADAEVGAAGPCLEDPLSGVAWGGIHLDPEEGALQACCHGRRRFPPWRRRRPLEVTALSGACLCMRRERFLLANGYDAAVFGWTLYDADLCLRLRQLGYRMLWAPWVHVRHTATGRVGNDNAAVPPARLASEQAAFRRRWAVALHSGDPFLNPHLRLAPPTYAPDDPDRVEARLDRIFARLTGR